MAAERGNPSDLKFADTYKAASATLIGDAGTRTNVIGLSIIMLDDKDEIICEGVIPIEGIPEFVVEALAIAARYGAVAGRS